MLKLLSFKQRVLSFSLLLAAAPTLATPLGSADMFNAYARSSFNYGQVDIQGIIGAGSDISFNNGGSIADQVDPGNSTAVYSGGNFTFGNSGQGGNIKYGGVQSGGDVTIYKSSVGGNINSKGNTTLIASPGATNVTSEGNVSFDQMSWNGNVRAGGDFYGSNGAPITGTVTVTGTNHAPSWYTPNTATNPNTPVVNTIDHQQISDDIVAASSRYNAMTANGTITNSSAKNWVFAGLQSLNIFDISDASFLNDFDSFTFDGPAGATFVLNIAGFDIDFGLIKMGGFNLLDPSLILFNFYETTSLNIDGSVYGTILAPNALVTTTGTGTLFGSLYANEITGSAQINNFSFDGEEPTIGVPEPGSILLMGIGLAGLLGFKQKRCRVFPIDQ